MMHKIINRVSVLALIAMVCSSCGDCMQEAKGIVVDKETKKPLDSAYFHKIGDYPNEYTDSTGTFEIRGISGGLFSCPLIEASFGKNGYLMETNTLPYPRYLELDTVFLTKIK